MELTFLLTILQVRAGVWDTDGEHELRLQEFLLVMYGEGLEVLTSRDGRKAKRRISKAKRESLITRKPPSFRGKAKAIQNAMNVASAFDLSTLSDKELERLANSRQKFLV
jgi:hypothetical protein